MTWQDDGTPAGRILAGSVQYLIPHDGDARSNFERVVRREVERAGMLVTEGVDQLVGRKQVEIDQQAARIAEMREALRNILIESSSGEFHAQRRALVIKAVDAALAGSKEKAT